jgi:Caspase domain
MTARAIVIGINDYPGQPLTNAVDDAIRFRDALIELGLVDEGEVALHTAPAQPGGHPADRQSLGQALKAVYEHGSGLDRLYVYFAGHGLSAMVDTANSVLHTFLLPSNVADLIDDSYLFIDLDDLRERLRLAGPREQFFFIDACRDLAFKDRPGNLPAINWRASEHPSPSPNRQAVLYAVSLGGKARGVRQGMGVMTPHLIDALHGRGRALAWSESEDHDAFVVTAESICSYVSARVEADLSSTRQWKRSYELPKLEQGDPPGALRFVENPPRPTFTLSFDPEEAAETTRVEVTLRGLPLQEPRWPPSRHGEAVAMAPHRYRLRATPARGVATVEPQPVDLREVAAATVRVTDEPPVETPSEPGPSQAAVDDLGVMRDRAGRPGPAVVRAYAEDEDPEVTIELEGLDPPYQRWTGAAGLEEQVPPGSYAVRFRLGPEVFSETEFDLVTGQNVSVVPAAATSPLLREALPEQAGDTAIIVSETIGPMQAGVLLTTLAVVGIKPFAVTGGLFSRFSHFVQPLHAAMFRDRPLRVVIAVEGDDWPAPVTAVRDSLRCEAVTGEGARQTIELQPLQPGEGGWARIVQGTAPAPDASFRVVLSSPFTGSIELAAAALPQRVTVIGLVLYPDGDLSVVQHLLRIPGRGYPEPVPDVPYGRMLRELVLGQRLFESGELIERGAALPDTAALRDLLQAKWTDPIVGCMAYYAWNDADRRGLPAAQGVAPSNTAITAGNLLMYFPELPDAQLIGALRSPPMVPLEPLLEGNALPVLARSCRELALAAEARGVRGIDAARWASRVSPGSPWTLVWEPGEDLAT